MVDRDKTCLSGLSSDQRAQLLTPSYKFKKEKREAKSSSTPSKHPAESVTLSPTLVDQAYVSVVGVVDGQGTVRLPSLSAQPAEKKVEEKKSVKSDKPTKSSSSRRATVSTDQRFEELDQKWSNWLNRLEALLLAKTGTTTTRSDRPYF